MRAVEFRDNQELGIRKQETEKNNSVSCFCFNSATSYKNKGKH